MKALLAILIVLCGILSASSGVLAAPSAAKDSANLRPLFEERYSAWTRAVSEWQKKHPEASYFPNLPEGQAIIDMGPEITPFLIEKVDITLASQTTGKPFNSDVIWVINRITRKRFPLEEYPGGNPNDRDTLQFYAKWWKQGRKETPKKFTDLVDKWDSYKQQGKDKDADEILRRISFLGLDALPLIIEKIKVGDTRFIPLLRNMMGNQTIGGDKPTAESILKWWEQNKAKLTLPPAQSAH